ncbi:uncharacterized protein LOC112520632 [Cynara cardunculus var. scolymus]|uniref:uncharacterized protein LOC112520632 n=1 Tax=Cynara cardunculus var. scolymus TaxID=59895 RepID=UPI000D62FA12|nr:uncharacterized protein LOC112520632 [Cynara cardunculus var. scolymus]
MAAADDSTTPPISILRRRNSIGTPTKFHDLFSSSSTTTTTTATSSSSSVDFELVSIKPTCYTSLRDILPSPPSIVHSPKPPSDSGYEISIRNRLVKQAAWAYLQPMSTSPQPHPSTVFHRLWTAVLRLVTAAFDCLQVGSQL